MNGCTPCEESLYSSSPLTISLMEFGGDILVYARNNGRNIVLIKRLVLCRKWPGGQTINYLREPDFIVGGERVEQGLLQLKYRASGTGVVSARAKAEYIEITGRSLSCELSFS